LLGRQFLEVVVHRFVDRVASAHAVTCRKSAYTVLTTVVQLS
jgi:hypothetical protein